MNTISATSREAKRGGKNTTEGEKYKVPLIIRHQNADGINSQYAG